MLVAEVMQWVGVAFFFFQVGNLVGFRRGLRRGSDMSNEMLIKGIFPLLAARGVTPAEFNDAVDGVHVGCGRPDCKACSRRRTAVN